MNYKFLLVSVIIFGSLLSVPFIASAEELVDPDPVITGELQTLEGIATEEVKNIPSGFGLWWRDITERVSIALTFDPVKKAEKQLQIAEERTKIANYITENSTDPKTQEKAKAMLERANELTQKITEKKDELVKNGDEKTKRLLKNIARHQLNKEVVLEKLEDKVSPEQLEKFQEFRKQLKEKGDDVLEKIKDNPNIPEEVKNKIEEVQTKVAEIQEIREEFRAEQKVLLEEIKSGRQDAKKEFEDLRETKNQEMEVIKEAYKAERKEIIEKIESGDETAKEQLKTLNEKIKQEAVEIRGEAKQDVKTIRKKLKNTNQPARDELRQNRQEIKEKIKEIR